MAVLQQITDLLSGPWGRFLLAIPLCILVIILLITLIEGPVARGRRVQRRRHRENLP